MPVSAAGLPAAAAHSGEVGAAVAGGSIIEDFDLNAAATPFGDFGVCGTLAAAAVFRLGVCDACHSVG